MSDETYISASQQVLLRVIEALGATPLQPQSLNLLRRATGLTDASRDQVFRALKNLEWAGFAERTPGGWRLTPKVTQISERIRRAIHDLHHTYLEPGDGQQN